MSVYRWVAADETCGMFLRQSWQSAHVEAKPPEPGGCFKIKRVSYAYRNLHCENRTILRLSYLHNGISYTRRASLYIKNGLCLVTRVPKHSCEPTHRYFISSVRFSFMAPVMRLGFPLGIYTNLNYQRRHIGDNDSRDNEDDDGREPGECQKTSASGFSRRQQWFTMTIFRGFLYRTILVLRGCWNIT